MLPAVQICFFCVAVGQKPTNLPLGVVNDEIQPFGSICDFKDGCEFQNFSCRYLSTLHGDPTLNLLQYKDTESAINAVEDGTIWGAIYIGHNFTTALVQTVLAGIKAEKDMREQSQIDVSSNIFRAHSFEVLLDCIFTFIHIKYFFQYNR